MLFISIVFETLKSNPSLVSVFHEVYLILADNSIHSFIKIVDTQSPTPVTSIAI